MRSGTHRTLRVPVPKLTTRGQKGKTRPAFSQAEVDQLLAYMVSWAAGGRLAVEREMRPLLRDYVELLLLTGMRHGTEAMGLRWQDLEWHTKDGVRYLRVWVSGKTGGRWLIAMGVTAIVAGAVNWPLGHARDGHLPLAHAVG